MKCKRLIAFLLPLCFFHASSMSQKVVVHNNTLQNITYVGIPNWLTVMADGYSCNKLVLKARRGRIGYRKDCSFNYYPDSIGSDVIRVFVKTKNGLKDIDSMEFHVKQLPPPLATVGGFKNGDSVSLGAFKAQAGVGAYLMCCGFEIKFIVVHFHLLVFRNGQIIFNIEKQSNSFGSEEIMFVKKQLEPGDKILIFDIIGRGESGIDQNLLPLQYVLK